MKFLLKSTLMIMLVSCFFTPQVVYANMAAPNDPDIGSSITFEKNGEISVLSEVLDITVEDSQAHIVATYKMKNTTDQNISTQSMFLSPNIENSGVNVIVNEKDASFAVESYALNYDTQIQTDDWQYAVLTDENIASRNEEQTVDTITFEMAFIPNEEYDVIVSYTYNLGGYPDYDSNAKVGQIEYYLVPASMWNDFGGITINLNLDEDMPVISSSNLAFQKIDARSYQYVSDTLPEENLEIIIDENWWQNIFSTFRSPYLSIYLIIASPFIVIAVVAVIIIAWRVRKKKLQNR